MRGVFKVVELDHQLVIALLQPGRDANRLETVIMAKGSQVLTV